jgi:hypothetical protein
MSSVPEQYTEAVQQAQQAFTSAVETWTKSLKDLAGNAPYAGASVNPSAAVDPSAVVDQVFDFAASLLAAQRDFTKRLLGSAASAAETTTSS